jgi:ParB family chromosome partitioning protein
LSYLDNQAYSSKSVEWHTPEVYLKAARAVMGEITLDPASCEVANQRVKAFHYYTEENSGLDRQWHGNVWLNPPFDKSKEWVNKLLQEYKIGNVKQAILLCKFVPNYVWFKPLVNYPMVVADHRVSFLKLDGRPGGSKLDVPIVFIYLGANIQTFRELFGCFGWHAAFFPGSGIALYED